MSFYSKINATYPNFFISSTEKLLQKLQNNNVVDPTKTEKGFLSNIIVMIVVDKTWYNMNERDSFDFLG